MKKLIIVMSFLLSAVICVQAQKTKFPELTDTYPGQKPPGTILERFPSEKLLNFQLSFSDEILITLQNVEPMLAVPMDINNDEDIDILAISGGDHEVCWFENLDGLGKFSNQNLISNTYQIPSCLAVTDLNSDNYLDIVVTYYVSDRVVWFKNVNGLGTFEEQTTIDSTRDGAFHVATADIDNDGDDDILVASWEDDTFAWYENLDGLGTFSSAAIIADDAAKACRVIPTDLDLDGDFDIVTGTNYTTNRIYWYENIDGSGNFQQRQTITTAVDNLLSIWISDIDRDGDPDILSASTDDDKTAWYENLDGNGTFGNQQIISTDTQDAFQVSTADLDNDSDDDVIVSCGVWNKIVYFLNQGEGNFGEIQYVWDDATFVHSTLAADIDNDEDQDLVSTFWGSDKIVWFRNELTVDVDDDIHNLNDSNIFWNYPNPFNPSTTIRFSLTPSPSSVGIEIYNVKGQIMRTFSNLQFIQSANQQIIWNGTDQSNQPVSSGLYYAVLKQNDTTLALKKMMLMK